MTVFALGFRPFFLVASFAGSLLMAIWLLMLSKGLSLPGVADPLTWHRHELLFGYTGAVVAGFLLTASRRWTGRMTPEGWPLALLVLVWIAARLVPLVADLPWLYAALDVAFWVGLFASLWQTLATAEWHNRVFLPLLALLAIAAGLSHAASLGATNSWLGHLAAYLALDLLVIVMLVVANRILPFFIQLGLQRPAFAQHAWLNRPLPWLLGLMLLLDLLLPLHWIAGFVNLLVASWLLPRLLLWHDPRLWRKSLLWSLYLAYAFLVLGLLLKGLGMLGLVNPYAGVHALTVGGIGLLTLSMMSRVALGHTGRALQPSRWILLAFVLMLVATLMRVAGVSFLGLAGYQLSALCWALALLIYFMVYLPILISPRPDGQPG